jgi:hypothetical protein
MVTTGYTLTLACYQVIEHERSSALVNMYRQEHRHLSFQVPILQVQVALVWLHETGWAIA